MADQQSLQIEKLTKDELDLVKAELKPEAVQSREFYENEYNKIMNEFPIFLFLNGKDVSESKFISAIDRVQSLIVPTDEDSMVGLAAALTEILSEVPMEKRGDYCAVALELMKNRFGTKNFVSFLTSAANVLLFPVLLRGGLIKGTVNNTLSVSLFSEVDTFVDASIAEKQLDYNLTICLKTGFENSQTKLCDFAENSRFANDIKSSLIYLPVMGTPNIFKTPKK